MGSYFKKAWALVINTHLVLLRKLRFYLDFPVTPRTIANVRAGQHLAMVCVAKTRETTPSFLPE